jgi:hypothetical protein
MQTYGTFAITGPQGSGKSLITTRIVRDFLLDSKLVASNLDFYLDKLLPYWSKSYYIRLPDYVTANDLWAIGNATESPDQRNHGLLVIDELAVIANARDWKAENRTDLISYLRHARKHGFNTFYLSQDVESIDAQIRKSLVEHVVRCKRTDRINIPIISHLLKPLGINLKFPLLHIATVILGLEKRGLVVDRWIARGTEFYEGYNTNQKFTPDGFQYEHVIKYRYTPSPIGLLAVETNHVINSICNNMHSVLSAWHLKGRYFTKIDLLSLRIKQFYPFLILAALIFTLINLWPQFEKTQKSDLKNTVTQHETQTTKPLKGFLDNGIFTVLILPDGSLKYSSEKIINTSPSGSKTTYYKVDDDLYEVKQ